MRLASACLASCFSIAWNRSIYIAMDVALCRVFLEGDQGVVGVIKGLLLRQPSDCLYYCPTLTSVLRESVLL
jgi:hypothetical protein